MIAPPFPADETHRLDALCSLPLLDTTPEQDFDDVVALGQKLFGVATCLVSLIDRDRQWFKARIGLDAPETPRSVSFCGHAILRPEVFVVLDAAKDERFHDNPLVTGAPFIRFYAGAPIELPTGYRIGTVCILGPEPRTAFTPEEAARLQALARLALNAISVRALRGEGDRTRDEAERYQTALIAAGVPFALVNDAGQVRECNPAFEALCTGDIEPDMPVIRALGLADGDWPPREGADAALILPSGARLRVLRDPEGFVLIGQ